MSKVNKTTMREKKAPLPVQPLKPGDEHLNYMGGPSYFLSSPIATLQMIAASSFFGEPQYYAREKGEETHISARNPKALSARDTEILRKKLNALDPGEWRNMTPRQAMESTIDAALDYNIEDTLKLAVQLRRDWHIRLTPQVIMVRAANHKDIHGKGKKIIGEYAPLILERTDDALNGLAYQLSAYGRKAIPNSLKKAWGVYLSSMNEYGLAKYRLEGHDVNIYDIVNLTHPKSEAIDKLMKGKLTLGEERETWESLVSREGSNEETWREAMNVMGHMALLRNIRNLTEHGIKPDEFGPKLVEGAPKGKQLPFRYVSAYMANSSPTKENKEVSSYIEKAMLASMPNMPYFRGRTMGLCDNSGSARNTTTSSMGTLQVCSIANLSALLTGYRSDEGFVGIFGDRLEYYEVQKDQPIFSQFKTINQIGSGIGGGTENGLWLFWDEAIRNKIWWDNVFIYSDMQAGHGELYGLNAIPDKFLTNRNYISVPDLINAYRKTVNPNVNVFSVQVAGYRDTILPEFYDRTYIIGGWGDGVFKFADEMIKSRNLLTGGQS